MQAKIIANKRQANAKLYLFDSKKRIATWFTQKQCTEAWCKQVKQQKPIKSLRAFEWKLSMFH